MAGFRIICQRLRDEGDLTYAKAISIMRMADFEFYGITGTPMFNVGWTKGRDLLNPKILCELLNFPKW